MPEREPVAAGRFYPASPGELQKEIIHTSRLEKPCRQLRPLTQSARRPQACAALCFPMLAMYTAARCLGPRS